ILTPFQIRNRTKNNGPRSEPIGREHRSRVPWEGPGLAPNRVSRNHPRSLWPTRVVSRIPGRVLAVTEPVLIADQILSEHFGSGLTLRPDQAWNGPKSTVLRCRIQRPSAVVPPSVIIKRSTCGAALEDLAASLFLGQLPREPPFAPRCYGADPGS